MPAIIKSAIKSEIAQIFYNSLRTRSTRAYFTLGKVTPWDNSDIPETPTASSLYERSFRENIVRAQYVSISDVTLACPRYNWAPGIVYDMYDPRYSLNNPSPSGSIDLENARFIVMTDDYNVYKCISNNYDNPSTEKPTGTSTGYIELSDGYVWKYLKTVSAFERASYLTPDYLPVSDVISEGAADGRIGNIVINDPGSGYDPANTTLTVQGDGINDASIEPVIVGGQITGVTILDPGSGYTQADIIVSTPNSELPQGTGADFTVEIELYGAVSAQADVQLAAVDGEISFVYINNGGSGYTSATAVITGDGTGATVGSVTIENGSITNIVLTDRGQDYTNATIAITGDGVDFQADVIIGPQNGHGSSPVRETYASAVAFFIDQIDTAVFNVSSDIEYRQVGLMLNPYKYDKTDGNLLLDNLATSCFLIEDASIQTVDYTLGETLYLNTSSDEMVVVGVDTGKLLVQARSDAIPTEADDVLRGTTELFTIGAASVTLPTFDKYSGAVLYIDNKTPFKKDLQQIANLRTIIQF